MIIRIDLSETIETLQEVGKRAKSVEADQVLDGILVNNYDTEKIRLLQSEVNIYTEKLKMDVYFIDLFAKTYNKQFPTDDNKFCDMVRNIYRQIKISLTNSMVIYKKLAKRRNRRAGIINGEIHNPLSMRCSAIGNGSTYAFCYKREEWGIEVDALCESIENFFSQLNELVYMCIELIREEEMLRRNPIIVCKIYEDSFKKVSQAMNGIILDYYNNNMSYIDKLTAGRIRSNDNSEFATKWYHKCNESEFNTHVINYSIWLKNNNGVSKEENDLFGLDVEKIERIRYIIQHFDETNPEGHTGKLSAEYIAALMIDSLGVDSKKEKKFLEYFKKQYKDGKFTVVGISAVNSAKNNLSDERREEVMDIIYSSLNYKSSPNTPKTLKTLN